MGWPDSILELLTLYCHWGCNMSVKNGEKIPVLIHERSGVASKSSMKQHVEQYGSIRSVNSSARADII
jgi:hypothetical protein